jgi:hypothetical protein
MQYNCKCNSLVTSFPSHQVSIFTHTHSVHFSAFSLHNLPCVTSHKHTPHHGYNAVAVQRGSVASAGIYCVQICIRSGQNRPKMWERWNIVGPYIPYGLFQTTGEMCAKFGSDRFRNVNLYMVQTNIQTFIFIYKILIMLSTVLKELNVKSRGTHALHLTNLVAPHLVD